jgi:aspartyl-tRNA(Asn)/glutamyl-tRNA(Gln) amidotransferase subunit A
MMDAAAESFRAAGAAITEVALPGQFADVMKQHRNIMAVESAAYHQIRLQRHPEDYDPWIRALLEEGLACPAPDYARAREYQRQLAREIQACFQGVDALLMPATTGPAPDAATTGNPAFNSPWSLTGLPTVSFPTGRFADGLPLAIQVVGPAWSEAELLATAAWCEAALGAEHKDPPLANPG